MYGRRRSSRRRLRTLERDFTEPEPEPEPKSITLARPLSDDEATTTPVITLPSEGGIALPQANARTKPTIKVVHLAPSERYTQARDLMLTAMHAPSEVVVDTNELATPGEDATSQPAYNGMSANDLESIGRSILGASPTSGGSRSGAAWGATYDPNNPNGGNPDTNATAMAHQDRNNDFVQSFSSEAAATIASEYNPNTRRGSISPYELKAGSVIGGVLIGGINSDMPGTIIGQVTNNIWDTATGAYKLIPQGSRIVGTYDSHVVYGQQRVLVVWNRIIYPDGTSLNIEGLIGADRSGYSGFKQKIDNHYSRMLGAALFASVFIAGSEIVTEDDENNNDDEDNTKTASEAVAEQMASLGAHLVERNLNVAPTLRILPGYQFSIITTKDIAFAEPYFD